MAQQKRATLTVRELAEYLGIGRNAAYKLVNDGSMPSVRIGTQIRIPKRLVDEWLIDTAMASKSEEKVA